MTESEEAFRGVFEFSVQETSKDLLQNGKLIVLKPEQEVAISLVRIDRMCLQSIYQIPVGDRYMYIVTAVVCMSLRRYVLKICFKVSEYTEC